MAKVYFDKDVKISIPDSAFGDAGIKQEAFKCQHCGEEMGIIKDDFTIVFHKDCYTKFLQEIIASARGEYRREIL